MNTAGSAPTVCWLCGHAPLARFAARPLVGAGQFTYLRCGRCGLARLAAPDPARDLEAFYAAEYEQGCTEFVSGARSLLFRLRQRQFHRLAGQIEARVPRGRLLDVGAGTGVFLATMRDRGWQVVGVEPHRPSVEGLRAVHGLDVRPGTLEDAAPDWGPFDAVTLLDVIEHLLDPRAAVAQAATLLRPGGVLVVATPNVAALEHRLFGRHWYALQPPDHLWLFSRPSLRRLLIDAGFGRVSAATSPVSYAWASLERALNLPSPPAAVDTALKAAVGVPFALAAGARAAPAQLELYAHRPA